MKMFYEIPEMEIQIFDTDDVVTLSNGGDADWKDVETGWGPLG